MSIEQIQNVNVLKIFDNFHGYKFQITVHTSTFSSYLRRLIVEFCWSSRTRIRSHITHLRVLSFT